MAQIKKIVKPGDTVRGAKVGLAALDKDGLVKSFPIPANSTGKYLGIDVSNNPGWFAVPALPAWDPISDMGKTLILQNQGPEWQLPHKVYWHNIRIDTKNYDEDDEGSLYFSVLLNRSSEFTTVPEMVQYITEEIGTIVVPAIGEFVYRPDPYEDPTDYTFLIANGVLFMLSSSNLVITTTVINGTDLVFTMKASEFTLEGTQLSQSPVLINSISDNVIEL